MIDVVLERLTVRINCIFLDRFHMHGHISFSLISYLFSVQVTAMCSSCEKTHF